MSDATPVESVTVSITLERDPGSAGWLVVKIQTKGAEVLSRALVYGPALKAVCLRRALFLLGDTP